MHIGIVLHPFGDSAKGLEQYIYETSCTILKESKGNNTFTIFVKGNPDTTKLPNGAVVVNLPDTFYWNLFLLPWYRKCDAFVFFTESTPLFLWKKSVVVFFDAAYYYFGSRTLYARLVRTVLAKWRSYMMRSSQHVVVISEASKRDLVQNFSIPEDHISVIYPGFKTFGIETPILTTEPQEPFFMYLGPMKERKNVLRIVEAYIEFRQKTNFSHQLYLVGRKSNGTYESSVLERIKESEYEDSIIFKTSVDDSELHNLYTKATALVYPSLLEGFGLPILEALNCGCFVITASTTSTKEAIGNAGFLVDPMNVTEIANAMIRVAKGEYDKEIFKKAARAQCDYFSWEKSGRGWQELFLSNAIQKNA